MSIDVSEIAAAAATIRQLSFAAGDDQLRLGSKAVDFVTGCGVKARPEKLVHYTTLAGLRGILTSTTIWATHMLFLNDRAEMEYGIAVCRSALDAFVAGDDDTRELKGQIQKRLLRMNDRVDIYAACFCVDDDLVSQWRGYGSGAAGYAISFDAAQLQARTHIPALCVRYDRDDQFHLVNALLSAVFDAMRSSLRARPANRVAVIQEASGLATVGLILLLATFKDRAFRHENEWRMLFPVLKQKEDSAKSVLFREEGEVLVPYVTFPLTTEQDTHVPIVGVRCGPSQKYEAPQTGIRYLLDQNGLMSASADKSTVPLRA